MKIPKHIKQSLTQFRHHSQLAFIELQKVNVWLEANEIDLDMENEEGSCAYAQATNPSDGFAIETLIDYLEALKDYNI